MLEFIERYLKKSRPEDITSEDVRQFLSQDVEEHQTLEYKPRGLLVDKQDQVLKPKEPRDLVGYSALAKSVASLANAEGGLLVLGVGEKAEKYKGHIIKIRPGVMSPLPLTVTRESIESNLASKIQYPIEGVTIVPVRTAPRAMHYVYLIDVPQSTRAPHRVNETHYYQRYNFTTQEMKHFQIADLFGRRLAPDLEIEFTTKEISSGSRPIFRLTGTIHNRGRAAARYVLVHIEYKGPYQTKGINMPRTSEGFQWETNADRVVYPDFSADIGWIDFCPTDSSGEALELDVELYAEGMRGKDLHLSIDPSTFTRTFARPKT